MKDNEQKESKQAGGVEKKKKRVDYKSKATQLETELAEQKDKYLRMAADMDNVRKNALKERQAYMKYKNESIARDLVAVVDDFERCLTHIPDSSDDASSDELSDETKALFEGINLIYDKFIKALSKNSITKMEVKPRDEFDVNKHEAVSIVSAGEDFAGKVVAITSCGYMLADKVVRYAKVVVGKKDEE